MKARTLLAALALMLVAACPDDVPGDGSSETTATTQGVTGGVSTRGTTAAGTAGSVGADSTSTAAADDPGETTMPAVTSAATQTEDTALDSCMNEESAGLPSDYDFNQRVVCDAVQQDRVGVPLMTTWIIDSDDAYNVATPNDDQLLGFAVEINNAIVALHAAFDDDVAGLGLMPCSFVACNGVVTPLVIPDVLAIDLSQPTEFPNGRHPEDPVADVMLGAFLLDPVAHPITALAELPLSPSDNDVPLSNAFPYLAAPH